MPLRRSDTMRAVDAVQPLVDQFNALDEGDKLTFLDLVDPLPDKLPHSHKQKKSSKKAVGGGSGKSKRGESLAKQISGRAQSLAQPPAAATTNDDDVRCAKMIGGEKGLEPCEERADHNIHHMMTHPGHHEFVAPPASSAAGAGD